MEEEDKKVESNSEIWRKHQEKEAKGLRKIFVFIFLAAVMFYIVNNGLTETKDQILNFFNVLNWRVAMFENFGSYQMGLLPPVVIANEPLI